MFHRVNSKKLKDGTMRYTGYVHINKENIFCLSTFPTKQRAEAANKLFLFWYLKYPNMNPHRVKNNYFIDAI